MQRQTQRTPKRIVYIFKHDAASVDLASLSSTYVLGFESGQNIVPLLGRICNPSFQKTPKLLLLETEFILKTTRNYKSVASETILPFIALQD